jgi:hypothetical protein
MARRKYTSKSNYYTDDQANVIGTFIDRVFPEGYVTSEKFLEAAKDKRSPVHKLFEWDNTKAAELYRKRQASEMIRCVAVTISGDKYSKYTTPIAVKEIGRSRVDIDIASKVPDLWDQVLARALADAEAWSERYKSLRKLSSIRGAIKKTVKKEKKRAR